MTSELRAEPGEAWLRDEGQGTPVVHPGRHRRAPEARSYYREVFAIGEFRALWSAQVLSYAGDQFAQVAIAILVYGRTHSPFLTALAYALTYLPPIAGGPLLSGLADLFPRRRVMIVSDLLGAMCFLGLAFAQQHSALRDRSLKLPVSGGKDHVESCPKHGDRRAVGIERRAMRGAVYARRESADDARPRADEGRRQLARDSQTVRCRAARADDGDARPDVEQVEGTPHPQMRWSIFTQVLELGRIPRITSNDAQLRSGVLRVAQPSSRLVHSLFGDRAPASTRRRAAHRAPAAPPS